MSSLSPRFSDPLALLLQAVNLLRINVAKDGNCAFKAVLNQLHRRGLCLDETVSSLRSLFVAAVYSRLPETLSLVHGIETRHIDAFLRNGHWAAQLGDAVIQFLARVLDVDIAIYQTDGALHVHGGGMDGLAVGEQLSLIYDPEAEHYDEGVHPEALADGFVHFAAAELDSVTRAAGLSHVQLYCVLNSS